MNKKNTLIGIGALAVMAASFIGGQISAAPAEYSKVSSSTIKVTRTVSEDVSVSALKAQITAIDIQIAKNQALCASTSAIMQSKKESLQEIKARADELNIK